jgi:hypothetical protein
MLFNVNRYVKVKLTEAGIDVLRRQHEQLNKCLPEKACKPFTLRLTNDGWYRCQLWSLMQTFGPEIDIEC